MRKTILILGLMLISLSLLAREPVNVNPLHPEMYENLLATNDEGQTWLHYQYRLDTCIANGKGEFINATPEIVDIVIQRNNLYFSEWEIKHGPNEAVDMGFLQVCWGCVCSMCGHVRFLGCSFIPINCTTDFCPYCHWNMYTGVKSCSDYCGGAGGEW